MQKQTMLAHLEELRWVFVRSILYLAISSVLAFFVVDYVIEFIKLPSNGIIENFFILKPTDSVTVYFKTIVFTGLIAAFIPISCEGFKFIKPALRKEQSFSVAKWSFVSILLFFSGVIFTYFVILPNAINFLINLADKLTNTASQIALNSYISFVLAVLLCGGIIFEIPLVCAALTVLNIASPYILKKFRKEVFFGLCVFGAIITPTTDIFSMALFVLPMIILYEAGIVISGSIYKKTNNTDVDNIYNEEKQ